MIMELTIKKLFYLLDIHFITTIMEFDSCLEIMPKKACLLQARN